MLSFTAISNKSGSFNYSCIPSGLRLKGTANATGMEIHAMHQFLCLRVLLFNSKIEITKIAFRKKQNVSKSNVKATVRNGRGPKEGKMKRGGWLIVILLLNRG